jgi:hypothetical protein
VNDKQRRQYRAPPPWRSRLTIWWIAASVIGFAAAAFLLYRWVLEPRQWAGADQLVTAVEVPAELAQGEVVADGANFTVQRFPAQNNCTLSVEFARRAVIGMTRSKTEVLVLFLASLVEDISAAKRATVQFADEARWTLAVRRVVTIVNVPVLYLEVPADLDQHWRQAPWVTLGTDGKSLGRFDMDEAQTSGLDALLDCANTL